MPNQMQNEFIPPAAVTPQIPQARQTPGPFATAVMPQMATVPAPVGYAAPQAMMAEGGLLQEGGTVDEASGNEVPTGSLKEEVRDDIPAQLSEGEFVFPADVVRFIGLERLMQLRQAAKEGLGQMEAMGQMGNADEATMDDTGDFETEIDDILKDVENDAQGFAEGGMPMPNSQQAMPQQPPMPQGMAAKPMMDLEKATPTMAAEEILAQSYADKGIDPDDDPKFQQIMAEVSTNRATMIRENNSLFVIAMDQPGIVRLHAFIADGPDTFPDSLQKLGQILEKAGVESVNPETSDQEVISAMQEVGMDDFLNAQV
jgi:hypothetical protein